jgi:hypothetical protein
VVKLKKITDIDLKKLNDLFRRRGHGILSDDFTTNINHIFEDPNSKYEVHQCDCGEVSCILKTEAEKLRLIQKTENIPCRKCQGILKGKFSFVLVKKISDIQEIIKINKLDSYNPSVLAEIHQIGKGIIPTGSMDEVFIGLNDLKRRIKDEPNLFFGVALLKYPIIDTIVSDVIKKDPEVAEKLLAIIDLEAKNNASENCNLRYIAINNVSTDIENFKFLGVPYQDYFPQNNEEKTKKIEINQKMTLYKDLFELGKYYLDFLLNLINVIENKPIQKEPFNDYSLPKTGGGRKKINGMFDTVLLFSYLKYGSQLHPILADLFDNKLRNDDGHNQYEIDFQKSTIRSLKYHTEITFEDLDKKISKLSHFFDYLDNFWVEHYLKSKKDKIKNLGIEEVSFCYQDSFVIDDNLFPLGDVLPVLSIFQYWDFAQYIDGKRYIPQPKITISDQILVSFIGGNTISYPLNSNMELWLNQLFLYEQFELALFTIAPLIPSFTEDAIVDPILINSMVEMNILDITQLEVPISNELKEELQNFVISH